MHTTSQQHSSGPDRLLRSRSGSSTSPAMNNLLYTPSASQRFTTPRSKSTAKSRTNYRDEEKTVISSMKKMGQENREGNTQHVTFASPKLMQRGNTSPSPSPRPSSTKGRKSSTSPSAWALSPGRSLPFAVGPEATAAAVVASPRPRVKSSGGGVGGVLKYFRLQKKGSSIQEEEYHQFRVLHNRLLQWRFANARARAAMVASHKVARDRMFSVWLRISKMRNYVLDKQLQVEKLKHQMKIYQIVNSQISLLNEWGKLEKKNIESVSRIVRKLSGISNTIPLVNDAKGDAASIHEAMITAMDVMAGIQPTVTKLLPQLEKLLYMVTELLIMQKQQRELEKYMTSVVGLMVLKLLMTIKVPSISSFMPDSSNHRRLEVLLITPIVMEWGEINWNSN
ncbi:PREDICTED: QWRF motif-containing protein 7 [Fragaria vesca subsp. vesca]|uniref:QWRF motif-containing protein 7 n=1 Tax=Fragaria vesca subsp. vesca TaxID=101020 RepID=UPI0002C34A90|nr:PREDICTED: QWRF motif-containing protein 7 [Fragaria vesca subsp. vesca]